ncbi:MAG: zinc ribbon domain-containing protein, partial [Nanoarchaeota archaeon]|nr:zinc ribbon domain-containing protein [Nanoarchaeota archaeon]
MEKKTNKESDNKSSHCSKCRVRIGENDLFCPDCGAKIIGREVKEEKPAVTPPDSAHNHCSKCKTEISNTLTFCPKCGTKQVANCSKCGAKLNKTDTFCTSCGHKLEKPATFASNSLTSGIFALFLGWIPIIGWILIIFALVYGFLSLNRIKKGNTLESRRMAIAGIVLGFIALAIALSVSIHYMYGDGTNDSTSGIFGPSDADTTSVLKMSPVISQFMEEHPKAITHFYHYSLSEFDVNKNDILFYCNHDSAFIKKTTIEPAEYSLATMTDKESKLYIIAFINWD